MSAALPIAALAALALAAKLRRGSRSWSDVDPLEQAKAEAEQLAAVMREERDKVRRRHQDLNSGELTAEIARKVWLRFPGRGFDWGNDRIVVRAGAAGPECHGRPLWCPCAGGARPGAR